MAEDTGTSSRRIVIYSPEAERDQLGIFIDTARQWSVAQAKRYSEFLLTTAQQLAEQPAVAPLVPNQEGVRCYVARWKNARGGHRIFFEEIPEGINVIRILHTAMNWEEQLGGD